ncbi:T9SS type A sorting domain-containing protein [bacterium]|nr:T9SS type A sorting domain-containing protein [bacterium]
MHTKVSRRIIFNTGFWVLVWINTLFCTENIRNREFALKQRYENDQWIDESKSLFYYDSSNQLNSIEYFKYQNNNWENDIIITYSYNADGQLEDRKETVVITEEILSHELYQYNGKGQLTQITIPDVPWFQAKSIFAVRVSTFSDIIRLDPYIMTNHLQDIRYTYDYSGKLTKINYHVVSDSVPSSIEFFPADNSNRPHPMDIMITTEDQYLNAIQSYGDSLKNIYPFNERNVAFGVGEYTYISNGHQLSVIYNHPYCIHYDTYHRFWSFYEMMYPIDMRTTWIYSSDTDSTFKINPQIGHINPQKEMMPFRDMTLFWLMKLFTEDQTSLPIDFTGRYDGLDEAHYSSKTEKSLSLSNYYIPGNDYDNFYEPRFQGSYPVQDRKVIKIIEQYRLNLTKLNSPIFYGIAWEYLNQWVHYLERNYEYNDSGQLQRNMIKRWEWDRENNTDPSSGWWENDSQYTFQYDESGNCGQINCSIWDTEDSAWKPLFRITYTYSDASNGESQQEPSPIQLSNYPNPFNTSTHVQFILPEPSEVSLKVYDITGKWIQTILPKQLLTGQRHTAEWNSKNSEGETVPSGMYLFQLEVGDQQFVQKCLYVK